MMRRLNEEMERLFDDFVGSHTGGLARSGRSDTWWPDMEVFERDGKLVVRAELPGMKREDVQVDVRDGELCISGERRHESERSEGDYYAQERRYGSFCRTISLPSGANADTASATFKDGLLTIEIETPRRNQSSQRRIEVREGESH
jgi:HSP20 family protein